MHLKKFEYHEKVIFYCSLFKKSETFIYFRFITCKVKHFKGFFVLIFRIRAYSSMIKWKAKCTFIWKEDFGPLSNSRVIFLFSPGKMLLTMFLFQTWLGSSFPEDVWAWWLLMHWLQLQFTPCEALPSVWIGFAWQYSQACGHPCWLSVISLCSK